MFIKVTFLLLLVIGINVKANEYKPFVNSVLLKKITKKYNIYAMKRFEYLQTILDKTKTAPDMIKLIEVNNYFNKVSYKSDIQLYKKDDYWATPWQFLGKDAGDCEDYVISKYFALIYMGVSPKKLFFTYVKSTKFKGAHMVLTYFKTPRSEPLVLDNNNNKVLPASKRKDLTPIYNFNGFSLERAKKRNGGKTNKSHKKWDRLLYNMKRNVI
jgi:predicted transglutaminase-like cysteine proteinase